MNKNTTEQNINVKVGRRLAREELFKLIFSTEILKEDLKLNFDAYLKRENSLKSKKELEFLEKYVNGIAENITQIKDEIIKNMDNWNIERIGNIERSLLILATYEILKENIATEIVVNEVVELAKEYGDTKTFEFINGVLAKIIKSNKD